MELCIAKKSLEREWSYIANIGLYVTHKVSWSQWKSSQDQDTLMLMLTNR